jgi:hypothetical protein
MQTFNSFDALAAANMTAPCCGYVCDFDSNRSIFTYNYYGDGVPPTCNTLSQVMISITLGEINDKLAEYDGEIANRWEWLKAQAVDINVGISAALRGDDNVNGHITEAQFNTRTGVLHTRMGETIGKLPVNPIDAITSAISVGDKQLIRAAEKVIWDFVNDNPSKFTRGRNDN